MLTELRITNLGVITDALAEFSPRLTAVTGETGAGKTMIVAGLGLLLGSRTDAGIVRHGTQRATIEGRWQIDHQSMEAAQELGGEVEDGELLTVRQISANARSRSLVGGTQVTMANLAQLIGQWATIHGQSEQQLLNNADRQRKLLDTYAQPRSLADYQQRFIQYRKLAEEIATLRNEALARNREVDMLTFALDEIAKVDPQPGEDVSLSEQAARLQASDDLRQLAQQICGLISGGDDPYQDPGAIGLLGQARKAMGALAALDHSATELNERLIEMDLVINDFAAEMSRYLENLPSDLLQLEEVTQRRSELAVLTRKYGSSIDEVLQWANQSAQRLTQLKDSDQRIELMEQELTLLDQELTQLAESIHKDRVNGATKLAQLVQTELVALALPHARLEFVVTRLAERNQYGTDKVELLFSANSGSALAPLSKVASGGELSRVRLALEVVLAGENAAHTFVFDEVDAGVGGAVGLEIGRRLKQLAETAQVIVVTHLAQVAAFADQHLVVTKSSSGEVTESDVKTVTGQNREAELARMMAGIDDSSAALDHAAELIRLAAAD